MDRIRTSVLFVYVGLILHVSCVEVRIGDGHNSQSPEEDFVPTREWQEVKPGQNIPKGLHVRMNMATGRTEAKLLDKAEDSRKKPSSLSTGLDKPDNTYDTQEIKEILTTMKGNEDATPDGNVKQRSYEELKKDFETLGLVAKTDSEIMTELYKEYIQTRDDKRKIEILNDLEYYVHQFDNGLNFVKMGGFDDIVIPGLNSSIEEVRSGAAYLAGSCTQFNPKVQIAAYEAGMTEILVKMVTLDKSLEVKNKALYALSVLCRQFPLAQLKLTKSGALSSFSSILQLKDPKLSKIQLKIIALLYDLVLEPELTKQQLQYYLNQSDVESTKEKVNELKEKLRQYDQSKIKESLLQNNWCQTVNELLIRIYEIAVISEEVDHDVVEKVLYFMSMLSRDCIPSFTQSRGIVESFRKKYVVLAEEDGDEYFSKLATLCSVILSQLKIRDEL